MNPGDGKLRNVDVAPPSARPPALLLALLAAAVAVTLYLPTAHFGFVSFDDQIYVVDNPHVRSGLNLDGLRWAFARASGEGTYWHPLTWVSHMLDCSLFGVDPGAHHMVAVAIHAANAALLFLVLNAATGSRWRSLAVAALFAVHPINVESVAWIAERKNLLSTCFWLATCGAWIGYARRPGTIRYLGALVLFVLGLLAKPMLVMLPAILLLLDLWPLRRLRPEGSPGPFAPAGMRRLIAEKLPLAAVAGMSIAVSLHSLGPAANTISFAEVPLGLRLANALVSIPRYLGKLLAPHDLAIFYPYPQRVLPGTVALAAVVVLVITSAGIALRRRVPAVLVGWLWFLFGLVPVSGLLQAGAWPALADRWAYVPAIGIFVASVWGVGALFDARPRAAAAMAIAVIVALAVSTRVQLEVWRDDVSLFGHSLAVAGESRVALQGLAGAWLERGDVASALPLLERAVAVSPRAVDARNALATAQLRAGRAADAERTVRRALTLGRDGETMAELGVVLLAQGRLDEAAAAFDGALVLQPDLAEALNGMGIVLARRGLLVDAEVRFAAASRAAPYDDGIQANLQRCRAWLAGQKP